MQRHEVLYLNSSRAYVKVNDTWYDTRKDFEQQVGNPFLTGYIDEVLSFTQYKKQFPESKTEMGPHAVDKTNGGGFVRKASSKIDPNGRRYSVVEYAVNPKQIHTDIFQTDISD